MHWLIQVWRENSWIAAVLGIGIDIAAFMVLGWIAGLILTGLFLVIALVALALSLRRRTAELEEARERLPSEDTQMASEEASEAERLGARVAPSDGNAETAQTPAPREENEEILFEALKAAYEGRGAEVPKILEQWVDEPNQAEERLSRRALMLGLAMRGGVAEAAREVRKLADENPSEAAPLRNWAIALVSLGELDAAIHELEARVEGLGEEKVSLKIQLAKYYRQANRALDGLALIDQVLAEGTPPADAGNALAEKGYTLEALTRWIEAFSAFEESLSSNPLDDDLRFHLAYEYSRQGLGSLAILHYEILLRTEPEHATALNNLGVEFQQRDLNIHGVEHYKEAVKRESSLAAANVAHLLIDKGLAEEAREWISRGEGMDDTHPNIAGAASRLESLEEGETSSLEAVREEAERIRGPIRHFHTIQEQELPEGEWTFAPGEVLHLHKDDAQSKGEAGTGASKTTIRIERAGNLLRVEWRRGDYTSKRATGFGAVVDQRLQAVMTDSDPPGRNWLLTAVPKVSSEMDIGS